MHELSWSLSVSVSSLTLELGAPLHVLPLTVHLLFLSLLFVQVVQQDPLVAALVRLVGGVDAAAGVKAGGGAQVQHHVVVWLCPGEAVEVVVLVEAEVWVVAADGGMGLMVEADASDGHPEHRVQAHVVARVDLSQDPGAQVSGQRREVYVVQLFGQQFAVQVDVGAVPAVAGLMQSKRVPFL